jgi:hypothetical protein
MGIASATGPRAIQWGDNPHCQPIGGDQGPRSGAFAPDERSENRRSALEGRNARHQSEVSSRRNKQSQGLARQKHSMVHTRGVGSLFIEPATYSVARSGHGISMDFETRLKRLPLWKLAILFAFLAGVSSVIFRFIL